MELQLLYSKHVFTFVMTTMTEVKIVFVARINSVLLVICLCSILNAFVRKVFVDKISVQHNWK